MLSFRISVTMGNELALMDIIRVFGTNVRTYRNEISVSQEKFAEMCGLHRTYISDIERFQRSISFENILRIVDALEIPTYKLYIDTEGE